MIIQKQNQKGFTAVEALIIIVIIAVIGITGYYVWHKDRDKSSATTTSSSSIAKSQQSSSSNVTLTALESSITGAMASHYSELTPDSSVTPDICYGVSGYKFYVCDNNDPAKPASNQDLSIDFTTPTESNDSSVTTAALNTLDNTLVSNGFSLSETPNIPSWDSSDTSSNHYYTNKSFVCNDYANEDNLSITCLSLQYISGIASNAQPLVTVDLSSNSKLSGITGNQIVVYSVSPSATAATLQYGYYSKSVQILTDTFTKSGSQWTLASSTYDQ